MIHDAGCMMYDVTSLLILYLWEQSYQISAGYETSWFILNLKNQKEWKTINFEVLTQPPSEGGTKEMKIFKFVVEPKLPNIILEHIKRGLNPKDYPCII